MGRLAQWLERLLHTQEVTGSSPVSPTITLVLSEELGLRELIEALLGTEGRRKLTLRNTGISFLAEELHKKAIEEINRLVVKG